MRVVILISITYITIFARMLFAQNIKEIIRQKIPFKIINIQSQIVDSLSSYFITSGGVLDSYRKPFRIRDQRDPRDRGKFAPIIVCLNINGSEIKKSEILDIIIDEFNINLKPSLPYKDLSRISSIPIDYRKSCNEAFIDSTLKSLFEVSPEDTNPIYLGKLNLAIFQKEDSIYFKANLKLNALFRTIRMWTPRNVILDIDLDAGKPIYISPSESLTSDIINVNDFEVAKAFYDIIDEFLEKKNLNDNSYINDFNTNIIRNLTNNLDYKLSLEETNNPYFTVTSFNLIQNFFVEYLEQRKVSNLVQLRRFNECTHAIKDRPDDEFKFNYFIKSGCLKYGSYSVREEYRNMAEYRALPDTLRVLFRRKEINATEIIKPYYHSLSIKEGRILNISLISNSNLDDLLVEAIRVLNQQGIIYDILEFFSRYATALITQDNFTLSDAWYDHAVRIINLNNQPKLATGYNVIKHILGLWENRHVWVTYNLIKIVGIDKSGIRFCYWDAKNNKFQEALNDSILDKKLNFFAEIPMKQNWYNFNRYKDEITYASIDTVDFIINIFNINKAKDYLSNNSRIEIEPDDYFGIMIYLKHLFQNDNRLTSLKSKCKEKYDIINKFLRLEDPHPLNIKNFLTNNFSTSYLRDDEKNELLAFFRSKEYEKLHLGYDIFHQAYIQILGSRTRPINDPFLKLRDILRGN